MATKQIQDYTAALTIDGTSDYLLEYQNSSTSYRKINRSTFLGVSGTPADISTIQTLTNKVIGITNTVTVLDSAFTIQDNVDNTKQAQFQLSGLTTGTTRTYTLPNASVTLASLTGTETLTNKTITSPAITGGTIDNSTITVDSISGHTTSTIVTVGGVQLNNGVIGTASAVTTNSIAAGAVVPNSLVASSGTGWAWQTFSPTWTNLTPGNGTQTAHYTQIGKKIFGFITFVLGSTSSIGSDPQFAVPVAASTIYTTVAINSVVGFGNLIAGAVQALGCPFFNASSSTIHIGYFTPSATSNALAASSATLPGTWTTGNQFTINFFYEAA